MRKNLGMLRHTAEWAKKFFHAKGASAAIIFGLTAATLLSAAGASIDLARGMMVKSRMASALDAAALAVGTTNGLSNDQLNALANQYFNANYPTTDLGSHGPVTVTPNGQHLTLTVNGSVPTTLLHLMNIGTLDFTVTNEVTKAVTKLRVALVLDNTGSMSQTDATGTSKISALKTATHQLLSQLQAAAVNPGDVQVSIIPFSLDVNYAGVDPTSNWIDWSDFEAPPPNSMPANTYGPQGSNKNCPYSTNTSPYGYGCKTTGAGQRTYLTRKG
jgi:Flp pilus assembly protein TadG